MDSGVPGGVYLCQVNADVSCGACCGLYNVADASRAYLAPMLAHRTRAFAAVPRTVAALDGFARDIRAGERQDRPFPEFHHCPFIGLIGRRHSRVGCLLHPLADGNRGVDYRGLSDYGGLACRTYFCPATRVLPARYKRILRIALDDWHLYGLVVTEAELVTALLEWLEQRLGRRVDAPLFAGRPDARRRLGELLALKIDWPFRAPGAASPCHYFFSDPPYVRPAIDYHGVCAAPSAMDAALRQLVSVFHTPADLKAAEQLLEGGLEAVARSLAASI
jgi:hypothetical protein